MSTPVFHVTVLPSLPSVARMLSDLLGKPIEVQKATPLELASAAAIAVYAYDDASPGGVALCDFAFASHTGAALSLVPPSVSEENFCSGELSEMIRENLREILNVCTTLFHQGRQQHLTLSRLEFACGSLPADVLEFLNRSARRLNLSVKIPEYGAGLLSLVVA